MMRRPGKLIVLVLLLGTLCARAARGQEAGVLEAAGRVPADAELALVIENASELRKTALAAAAGGLFDAGGPLSESRTAWRALSAELGWTEEETFDRLLGRRVVLIAKGIDDPDTATWVLMSQVSLETDRRLKEKLKAAPRGIAQGQQMLAIEGGRYELTSHRQGGKGRQAAGDDRSVTVLLAPAGRARLLDGMLEQLVGGKALPRLLRDEEVHAEASKLGKPEILLLARLGGRLGEPAAGAAAWPDFMVLSASRGVGGAGGAAQWTVHVALRERARQKQLLAAGISSDSVFRELSPSSLLTVVQMAPLATIFGRTLPFDDPLTNLPWPARAADLFTGRQIIRVTSALGDGPAPKPGLACTLAMETTDGARLATVLDPSIGTFFAEVERAAGQRDDMTPRFPEFAGFAPQAPRILGVEIGRAGSVVGVTGSGLTVAWAFPSTGEGTDAWWALAMSGSGEGMPRAAAAVRDVASAVKRGGEAEAGVKAKAGQENRWIWLMSARPRELDEILAPEVPDFGGIRTLMRRVSEAGCRLSITDRGDIQGEVTLRLIEAAGR